MARIAAASASLTTHIPGAWGRAPRPASRIGECQPDGASTALSQPHLATVDVARAAADAPGYYGCRATRRAKNGGGCGAAKFREETSKKADSAARGRTAAVQSRVRSLPGPKNGKIVICPMERHDSIGSAERFKRPSERHTRPGWHRPGRSGRGSAAGRRSPAAVRGYSASI